MLDAADAAKAPVHHVTELTGRTAEGVGVDHRDDGWRVTVEIVEIHRIPDSADILAVYETEIDQDGELVSFRRTMRYLRGRVGKE